MSLSILNISPSNGTISVPMDQKITIKFSEDIDPFTVANGVNLYTTSNDETDGFASPSLEFEVTGDTLTVSPSSVLQSDKTYYISVFPGNDATRFISAKTTADPEYLRVGSSTGTIAIKSAYTGNKNGTYILRFTGPSEFDLTFGIEYLGSFTISDTSLNLGKLTISTNGTFDDGDEISINVFSAIGLNALYKTTFTTSKYVTVLPTSTIITDDSIDDFEYKFNIVNTLPEDGSVNNLSCNPIIIKFNKEIKDQDLSNKINIKRTDLKTGRLKHLNFTYKISGNILKIYLIS